MTTTTPGGPRRLELWVREGTPEADLSLLSRRLDDLERTDRVADARIHTWEGFRDVDRSVRLGDPTLAARRLADFRAWARRHGEPVPGLGETTTVGVGRMGPETTVQRLPRAVLAEFRGETLVRLTPCAEGTPCVLRRLDALARRTGRARPALPAVPAESGLPAVPAEPPA